MGGAHDNPDATKASLERVLVTLSNAADEAAASGNPDLSEAVRETAALVRTRCADESRLVACITDRTFEVGFARGFGLNECVDLARTVLQRAIPALPADEAEKAIAKTMQGPRAPGHRPS